MARTQPDRSWFTGTPKAAWASVLSAMFLGGSIAWYALGAGLCEDDGSSGTDSYCNRGGWEASGLGLAALFLLAVVVPAVAVVAGSRRWFWLGLISPPALAVLDVVLSAKLGVK